MAPALHLVASLLLLSQAGVAESLRGLRRGDHLTHDSSLQVAQQTLQLGLQREEITGAVELAWPRRALLQAGDAPQAADPADPADPPPDGPEPLVPEEPPPPPVLPDPPEVPDDPPAVDPPADDPPADDPPADDPPADDPPEDLVPDPPTDTPEDPPATDDPPESPDDDASGGDGDSDDDNATPSGGGSTPSPPRNSRNNDSNDSSSGSDNTVAIAVGVAVAALVVVGIAVLLCCFCKRKKDKPSTAEAKTEPAYDQYNATATTGAMDPRYAAAVPGAASSGMQRSKSGRSKYPSDSTMYPSRMSSQAYSSMQSPMSSYPSKVDQEHGNPAHMWTYMSWTNTSDAPYDGPERVFFIPPAAAKVSSADFTHAANKYLMTRQARNVTVIGAMADHYGTEDVPSWTATNMSAGSGASRSPSMVLEKQLDWLERSAGGMVLRKYKLLGKAQRRQGGQGLVAFAQDRFSDGMQYAIKFYFGASAFARERDILENKGLNRAMPACQDIIDSEKDRFVSDSPNGPILLPPMIITEKGESLNEYIGRKHPDFITCMQVIVQIAEKLHIIHDAGYVHRDLKPSNAIWLPSQNTWSLIDFGCTAKEGTEQSLSFSLLYAAPEVVTAFRNGANSMTVSPAVDVFAFGVMCYELLTRSPYYGADPNGADVCAMLEGKEPMPHENMSPESERKLGALRQTILVMLSRNPEERCSIEEMLRRCQELFGIATYDFQ